MILGQLYTHGIADAVLLAGGAKEYAALHLQLAMNNAQYFPNCTYPVTFF